MDKELQKHGFTDSDVSFSKVTTFDQVWKLAKIAASSDLVPKDYKDKPANVLVAWEMGRDLGLKPMQAIQNIAVINGRPGIWGDAVLAIIQSHPDFEYIQEEILKDEKEGIVAVCTLKRKSWPKPTVRKFSEADAKAAGLLDKQGPWRQYKQRMCQMRARSFSSRDTFADALKGIQFAEEIMDYPEDVKVVSNANKANQILSSIENKSFNSPAIEDIAVSSVQNQDNFDTDDFNKVETFSEERVENNEEKEVKKEESYAPSNLDLLKQALADEKTPVETLNQWLKQCNVKTLNELTDAQAKILISKVYSN